MLKNFNLCMINIILKGKIVINIAFEKYKNFYYFFPNIFKWIQSIITSNKRYFH